MPTVAYWKPAGLNSRNRASSVSMSAGLRTRAGTCGTAGIQSNPNGSSVRIASRYTRPDCPETTPRRLGMAHWGGKAAGVDLDMGQEIMVQFQILHHLSI